MPRYQPMSALNRNEYLNKMSSEQLDLLIIGGGITGAGIALDASARGLKVGLVEQNDFSSGTSSRSTKLIHGGLRYLKQGELKLVQEVGQERAVLHQNAPHIVVPEHMLLPLVQGGSYGKIATSFGLWLYDRLAGVEKQERRKMLSKAETIRKEPLLRQDILRGAGLYVEYRTDDARLTIEVLKTAATQGAQCVNYAEVTRFIYAEKNASGKDKESKSESINGSRNENIFESKDSRVIGVEVQDKRNGEIYPIYAHKIVSATGPWADQLRVLDNSLHGKRLRLTKGVHIVVPYARFPINQAVYFDVADKRMIFAIPRGESTYIGTTDTDYDGPLENPNVTTEDVTYLLQAVNGMFPTVQLIEEDVTSTWAGLRSLVDEEGKSPSQLSRKDEVFVSDSGLITVAGGKLTGYRKMAERVVDIVMKQLHTESERVYRPCTTDKIILSGGDFLGEDDVIQHPSEAIEPYIQQLMLDSYNSNVDKKQVTDLVLKYGMNTTQIITIYKQLMDKQDYHLEVGGENEQDCLLAIAELTYTIQEEMVTSLDDFFIRRTGRLYFEREKIGELSPILKRVITDLLS